MSAPVTVRDVLALPVLEGAEVVGPAETLDRLAVDVDVLESSSTLTTDLRAGSVVLLSAPESTGRWSHLLELLIRRAAGAKSAALMVPHPRRDLPVSVSRVAERLSVPVVLYRGEPSPVRLAVDVRLLVGAPEVVESDRLLGLVDAAPVTARSPERIVELVQQTLGGEAGIISARRRIGNTSVTVDEVADVDDVRWWRAASRTIVAMRVGVPRIDEPTWLVAEHPAAGRRWPPFARRALALVRGDVVTWLAAGRLDAERHTRTRSLLLNEIVERGSVASPDVLRETESIGWRLQGWQTGIHVTVLGHGVDQWAIETAVREASTPEAPVDGVVQRSDGWVMWLSGDSPPSPATLRETVRGLRREFDRIVRDRPDLGFSIGIGSPQRDADGLARTLAEAREAAAAAPGDDRDVTVQAVQDLGASRLLLGWYGSGVFREVSRQILAPLTDGDDEEMMRTLEAYLERACSAAQTARVLGVHRNTVALRVSKAEDLLGASLSHADTRLALQLALRARHHDVA